jgi:hypothetical protein
MIENAMVLLHTEAKRLGLKEWPSSEQEKDIDKDDSEQRRQSDAQTDHEEGASDQDREAPSEEVGV